MTGPLIIQSNLTVQGVFEHTGSTTLINSTNLDISDNLISLNTGIGDTTNTFDIGLIMKRGGTTDPSENAFIGWRENEDEFTMGLTNNSGDSLGTVSIDTLGTLRANIIGTNLYIDASNNGDISANDASFNDVSANNLFILPGINGETSVEKLLIDISNNFDTITEDLSNN